jgi:hypothetical protein
MRVEVLTAVTANIDVFLCVMLCSLVEFCQCFGECLSVVRVEGPKNGRIFNHFFAVLTPTGFLRSCIPAGP